MTRITTERFVSVFPTGVPHEFIAPINNGYDVVYEGVLMFEMCCLLIPIFVRTELLPHVISVNVFSLSYDTFTMNLFVESSFDIPSLLPMYQ